MESIRKKQRGGKSKQGVFQINLKEQEHKAKEYFIIN